MDWRNYCFTEVYDYRNSELHSVLPFNSLGIWHKLRIRQLFHELFEKADRLSLFPSDLTQRCPKNACCEQSGYLLWFLGKWNVLQCKSGKQNDVLPGIHIWLVFYLQENKIHFDLDIYWTKGNTLSSLAECCFISLWEKDIFFQMKNILAVSLG